MPGTLSGLAWVAAGSALGGMARHFMAALIRRRFGDAFPWGTIAVNVTGAFAIGVLAAVADRYAWLEAPGPWQLAVVGMLGSYTTVSAFSLQTLTLARDRQVLRAAGNVLLSVGLCLAAVAAGFAAGCGAIGPARP